MQVAGNTLPAQEASTEASSFGGSNIGHGPPGADLATVLLLGTALFATWFAWLTPNHYQPWLTFHSELAMVVAGTSYGVWSIWQTQSRLTRLPAVAAAALLAAGVPFLQLLLGVISYAGDAWLACLYLVGFALVAWFGHEGAARYGLLRSLKPLHAVFLAGAIASMWLAFYQWLGLGYFDFMAIEIVPGMRPYANVVQPNQLATLLVLGMVATAFFYEARTIGPFGAVLATLFLAFGVAMTQSRAGWLEIAVVAGIVFARKSVTSPGVTTRPAVVAVACLALAMPLAWEPMRGAMQETSTRSTAALVAAGKRPIHWASLADAVQRRPWLGYGWNQVGEAQWEVVPDHPSSYETISHSHNLALDLLVENGIPLGTVFILALLAWFGMAIKRVRDRPTLLALCSVIAVFVHAMLEFPLHYAYFLLPVGVLMGAISWQVAPGFTTRLPRWVAPLLLVAVAGLSVAMSREYFQFESALQDRRFSQARIGSPKPFKPLEFHVLTQLSHYWNFAYFPQQRGVTAAQLAEMRLVMLRFPSRENMIHYAAFLALNGQADKAPAVLRRVCPMVQQASCEASREAWAVRGRLEPEIAAIAWPAAP